VLLDDLSSVRDANVTRDRPTVDVDEVALLDAWPLIRVTVEDTLASDETESSIAAAGALTDARVVPYSVAPVNISGSARDQSEY
jgi:hypothetical protein